MKNTNCSLLQRKLDWIFIEETVVFIMDDVSHKTDFEVQEEEEVARTSE